MITLSQFLYETFWTIFLMTFFLLGGAIASFYLAYKKKIIFSKKEYMSKGEEYTGVQFLFSGFLMLSVSIWYNFYKGHMFYYIKIFNEFISSFNMTEIIINIIPIILYIYLVFIFIWIFFRPLFVKGFAEKKGTMYSLNFIKIDKIFVCFTLLSWSIIIISKGLNFDFTIDILIQISIFFLICILILYVNFTKVLFDDKVIKIYYFWRRKQIVQWKEVEKLTYSNKNKQAIFIKTKNNEKYKISNYLSGLETFISQYKIRNKKNKKVK